jgi:hypothetical protein
MKVQRYVVLHEPRQNWAWVVTDHGGPSVARCKTEKEAERVADALNLARRVAAFKAPGVHWFESLQDDARELLK